MSLKSYSQKKNKKFEFEKKSAILFAIKNNSYTQLLNIVGVDVGVGGTPPFFPNLKLGFFCRAYAHAYTYDAKNSCVRVIFDCEEDG